MGGRGGALWCRSLRGRSSSHCLEECHDNGGGGGGGGGGGDACKDEPCVIGGSVCPRLEYATALLHTLAIATLSNRGRIHALKAQDTKQNHTVQNSAGMPPVVSERLAVCGGGAVPQHRARGDDFRE